MASLLPWQSRRHSDVESVLEPLKSKFFILGHHFEGVRNPPLQNQYLSDQESVESPSFGRDWPENAELGFRKSLEEDTDMAWSKPDIREIECDMEINMYGPDHEEERGGGLI